MKNPLTPAGIESATFRIVAQHLNHCATAVPHFVEKNFKYRKDRKSSGEFILVINQLDAQNVLFYNKLISRLNMFRAPCAHHQEVKIVLYSLW